MTVDRDVTMARLAKLSSATLKHTPGQKLTVGDVIEQRAAERPDHRFLRYRAHEVSYAAHNAACNRFAHWGMAQGLATGDVAAILLENRPDFLAAWGGLCKLGVVSALVNTQLRHDALRHMLETSGARHVIVGSECLANLESLTEEQRAPFVFHVLPDPEQSDSVEWPAGALDLAGALASVSDQNPDRSARDGLVAGMDLFFIFTSGTTGLPKAARLSHMRFLGVGDGMAAVAEYGPDDVIYCALPLFHGAGGMVVTSISLATGGSIALRRKFSATRFWDDVRTYGVTGFQYIGEMCRYLLNQPPSERDRDHAVRLIMGAGLGADMWQTFQERFGIERILEGWSSTEANTNLLNVDNRVGSCGRIPYPDLHNGRLIRYDVDADCHVRDGNGAFVECEPGEVGEFIGMVPNLPDSGAGRFEGYTSAEATEAKLLRNVFSEGDEWYRSGDLLRRDEDDYFYFVDRIGDTYRWKSENVSTQEVAEVLSAYPQVQIANVYGVRVEGSPGRAGMAGLVLSKPETFDGRAFFAFAEEHLARYAAPVFLRIQAEASTTSTFKLRKVDLQREGYDTNRVSDPLYVRDEGERSYLPLSDERLLALGLGRSVE